jgi:hypothetical protein
MLRDTTREIHDPILDLLIDALADLPEPGEEICSSALEWPSRTDLTVGIGPALIPDELLPDDPDPLPLTGPDDLDDLRNWERFPALPDDEDLDALPVFEPSPEDLDALERLTYERRYGCNARFV